MSDGRTAAIAALVGFAVMGIELTAVRLMAPHFGDSAYVWTNVIGVILVALALGAWLGGRAASKDGLSRRLAVILWIGGAWTGVVPFFADGLGEWLVPFDLPLDAATGALVFGSLCGTLILFAPAVLLAGMVTPMLVAAKVVSGSAVGRASGLVASLSTMGSLVGTFAATHLLIPGIGSRLTFGVCALALVIAGVVVSRRAGARAAAAGAAALPAILLALLPHGPRGSVVESATLVAEVESAYQFLAVVRGEEQDRVTTQLQINEGLDSFHSIAIDGTPYTNRRYYDYYASMPFLRTDGDEPQNLRILSLGAAAGTFERLLDKVCLSPTFESVELDPAVVALAEEHFGGFPDRTQVFTDLDARVYVNRAKGLYDLVFVDAYERQVYIPAHVASVEFFTAVQKRLEDGGIVAINAGGVTADDPVVMTVARTMATVFGESHIFSVPRSRNFMVAARAGDKPLNPAILAPIRTDDETLNGILSDVAEAGLWRTVQPGQPVLTDDRPFLDRAHDLSLRHRLGVDELMPLSGGGLSEREAFERVMTAWNAKDYAVVEQTLLDAGAPTATLRVFAGDLRWTRRDLLGARAEYLAAVALARDSDEVVQDLARRRLESLALDIEERETATSVGSRNAWMAMVLGALLMVGAFVGRQFG